MNVILNNGIDMPALGFGVFQTPASEIGGRVFKTQSGEELAYLSRIVGWAKAARLVRVTGTKLAPVKKNAGTMNSPSRLAP